MRDGVRIAGKKLNCKRCGRRIKRGQKYVRAKKENYCRACVKNLKMKLKY